jgi:hypothetical protein
MDANPIIKAKIQGMYRSCRLLSYIGNDIHVRIVGNNLLSLPDEHFVSIDQIRKQDRDACLAIQCPPKRYRITVLRRSLTMGNDGKKLAFNPGKSFTLSEGTMKLTRDTLEFRSRKHGVLAIPLG